MLRFLVPPETLTARPLVIGGEAAHQIMRVLRMRAGDEVLLLDGRGMEYLTRLVSFGKDEVSGVFVSKRRVMSEPDHVVDIYISLLNTPQKVEWVLQKCTELGAARFVPIVAGRSIFEGLGQSRRARWERII